jgi:hypothetical protein
VLSEFERDGGHGRRGAVLDGQGELVVAAASEIEVGVAPGVELGGAAQGRAGADAAGAFLGMVDDDDGEGVSSLQFAQIREQRRHVTAGVFVDAMETDKGIEDEQARLQRSDRLLEASAIGLEIEAQGWCGDHLDVEVGETEACGGTDPVWLRN